MAKKREPESCSDAPSTTTRGWQVEPQNHKELHGQWCPVHHHAEQQSRAEQSRAEQSRAAAAATAAAEAAAAEQQLSMGSGD